MCSLIRTFAAETCEIARKMVMAMSYPDFIKPGILCRSKLCGTNHRAGRGVTLPPPHYVIAYQQVGYQASQNKKARPSFSSGTQASLACMYNRTNQ